MPVQVCIQCEALTPPQELLTFPKTQHHHAFAFWQPLNPVSLPCLRMSPEHIVLNDRALKQPKFVDNVWQRRKAKQICVLFMGIRHGIIAPIDYEFRRYTAFFKQERIGLLSLVGWALPYWRSSHQPDI